MWGIQTSSTTCGQGPRRLRRVEESGDYAKHKIAIIHRHGNNEEYEISFIQEKIQGSPTENWLSGLDDLATK